MTAPLPLPDRPNLDHYRNKAKSLLAAARRGDAVALSRIAAAAGSPPQRLGLSHAQLAVAREHGFASWPKFRRQVERLSENEKRKTPFERAADAVVRGEVDTLRAVLREHPEVTAQRGPVDYSLLHHAAGSKTKANTACGEIVRVLLDAGMSPDTRDEAAQGATPLHFAATLDHLEVMKVLLDAGARIDLNNMGDGGTPLAQALFYGAVDAAELLASYGVMPDNLRIAAGLGLIDRVRGWFDSSGKLKPGAGAHRAFYRPHDEAYEKPTTDDPQEVLDEAFVYACNNRRYDAAAWLLERGADINARPHYHTALHMAAYKNDERLIGWLLDQCADPALRDLAYDAMPYGWAWHAGHADLMQRLQRLAAQRDLFAAASIGDRDQVERLTTADTSEHDRGEALMAALEHGHDDVAQLLRQRGAKPNNIRVAARLGLVDDVRDFLDRGDDPTPALILAADHRRHDVARLCLQRGAAVGLHPACSLGWSDRVQQLLAEGADVDQADSGGERPLHKAIKGGSAQVVDLLLNEGADVDANADHDSHGARALHVAAASGAGAEIIDLLLTYGADINQPTNAGTPLDCARRAGRDATAKLIRERGGKSRRDLPDAW